MNSNYSGLKVRNSIMKMLAPYPRNISVKTLRALMNDFEGYTVTWLNAIWLKVIWLNTIGHLA